MMKLILENGLSTLASPKQLGFKENVDGLELTRSIGAKKQGRPRGSMNKMRVNVTVSLPSESNAAKMGASSEVEEGEIIQVTKE